jgi:hypothetical protein
MGAMLTRSALFYEGESARWIERFTKVFEPVLMTAIGLLVGLIVILLVHADFRPGGDAAMNAPGLASGDSFDDALLQQARRLALASGGSLVTELEALTGIEPRQVVDHLARRFRLAVMDTTAMLACAPAFDLLPMVKAQTRGCVLLRSPQAAAGSQIIGVIAGSLR